MSTSSPEAMPSGAAEAAPDLTERAQVALVAVAAVQGIFVGVWLGFVPSLALRLGGFPPAPQFFVRWAGVLHVVLAVGYVLEWLRFRRVSLLVVAKGATALFLAATWVAAGLPLLMVFATLLEGVMACAAGLLQAPADRSRRARVKLKLVTPVARAEQPDRGQAPVRRS